MNLWTKFFINLALMLCLEGKKSNKIVMALTLFLWSQKYFVISNIDQIVFLHAISLNKKIRLILHLFDTKIS